MRLAGTFWLWLLTILTTISPSAAAIMPPSTVQTMVTHLVQREDQATMSGNQHALKGIFTPHSSQGLGVYDKAVKRMTYMNDWARARQIHFDGVTVHVRIGPVHWMSPTEVKVYGADQAQYRYHHLTGNRAECWFGLGVYHWYVLKQVQGVWYINQDTFIDPLNQDTRLKGPALPAVIQVKPEHRSKAPMSIGAQKAVLYANQYCGAAPGCGHDNRYNSSYVDFNWNGGDCSNFISQVLKAGGFTESQAWSWDTSHGDGTAAWVNATRLSQYLQRSGRATVFARGTLPHLLKPDNQGITPLDHLGPGDLVGYFETGRVVHFAIVVGFDADGYPLVISHSADRYREPWDLGWDRTTTFLLFHVHYPDVRNDP